MKSTLGVCLVLALLSASCYSKQLPLTPKAGDLEDHFGQPPKADIYGPKKWPTVEEGSKDTIYVVNQEEVYENQKGGAADCDIKGEPYYQICHQLNSCGLCSASPHCGWCDVTQKCYPGTSTAPSCGGLCKRSWFFDNGTCFPKTETVYGSLTNVAPEARRLRRAEIADPKVKVDSVSHTTGVMKHTDQVGYKIDSAPVTTIDQATGQVIRQSVDVAKPVYAQVEHPVNVVTHHQKVVNLKTGEVKELGYGKKQFLGTDMEEETEEEEEEEEFVNQIEGAEEEEEGEEER